MKILTSIEEMKEAFRACSIEQNLEELLALMNSGACACLRNEELDTEGAEISLSFVAPEEIQEMNRRYREVDSVTDVLSFPLNDWADEEEFYEEMLGDVIICPARACEQASEYGHSVTRELVYLFVHSTLHLLGYDHMNDEEKAEMREAEEAVMNELGITR